MKTALLDPPWPERGGGKIKRGADRHYDLINNEHQMLQVIVDSGLWTPCPYDGCSVWMWTTRNSLPMAFRLLNLLCATYVTSAVWIKAEVAEMLDIDSKGKIVRKTAVLPQRPGLGKRMRGAHEYLLYSRIGAIPLPLPEDQGLAEIYAPRTESHSEKPEEAYELIEAHDPPGEKVEFFANKERDGWVTWGNGH